DFDDALSFQKLDNGNYQVGVHIADVSHYVKPDSVLDQEAYSRGNSIYLVDRTIPMLPEVLSNKACSLRPDEDKYTFSALFELNNKAELKNSWFGKTVTRSNARFSYEESQYILDTQNAEIPAEISRTSASYSVDDSLVEAHLALNKLAETLRAQRISNGAITFDSTEVKFTLNADNAPTGIYFKKQKAANNLIEEFML